MKFRRDLIIVALATFCLTSTLFMVVQSRSDSPNWDPWADIKEDGNVDIYDAITLANAFGSEGNASKKVNVTSTPVKVIQQDLNISIYATIESWGEGWGFTDVIETAGYDRMFVSAAIIGMSNCANGTTRVGLTSLAWCWGTANGVNLTTHAYPDYNKEVNISVYDPGHELPLSTCFASEFAIQAADCKATFQADSWFRNGWVLLRVSFYLTTGTTSLPTVQGTYVTNWPSAEPTSYTGWNYIETPIVSGQGYNTTYVYVGGYSRMFVNIRIENTSYYGFSNKTTISLIAMYWDGSWLEPVPLGVLNATYYGGSPTYSQQVPVEFETKGSYCILCFSISSEVSSGWVEWYAHIYLRNE